MKNFLIVLFVLIGFTAKSQTIDTTFKSFGSLTACKIQSFKAKWTDTVNVDHLGVRIISDDLKSTATLYWALLDSNNVSHVDGTTIISGEDYKNWGGDNIFPFAFVGRIYNLVFIKPE